MDMSGKVSTAANTGEQAQNRANSDEEVSPDEDQTEDSDFDVIAISATWEWMIPKAMTTALMKSRKE